MITPIDTEQFARLAQQIAAGSTLLRVWPLMGGVSAQVMAMEIERPDGQTQKLVVRRHGEVDRTQNPHIAVDEYRLLQLLHDAGLAVPTPCLLDETGELFGTPAIVVEFVEGTTEFAPASEADCLRQLATQLSWIHRIDAAARDLAFLPRHAERCARRLRERPPGADGSIDEQRIREMLVSNWPPQGNPAGLLHGDYWPGNTLWRDGRLVAVIDWEDAAVGDPLADLGNSRLEILWAFGIDAMQQYTQRYLALNPIDRGSLPYWDLYATLRPIAAISGWGLDPATEQRMRSRLRWFIAQAFDILGA